MECSRRRHHAPVIGCVNAKDVNAKELLAGLAVFGEPGGLGVESPRGERLVDRDSDASDPGITHAHVAEQISATIDNSDFHWLTDLLRPGSAPLLFLGIVGSLQALLHSAAGPLQGPTASEPGAGGGITGSVDKNDFYEPTSCTMTGTPKMTVL